jgi:two-component system, response regulator
LAAKEYFLFARGKYSDRSAAPQPKVVLLDVDLPKLGGFDVLRELRADRRMRMLPAVMVTSSPRDPDVRTAYELGANSYVVKPAAFDAFVEAICQIGAYWLRVNRSP